ncbi:MAG TPA: ABC transporter substrate-binding protein [Candidatus Bipolaricaulota bacterium]|nr:ABC transporter substrate-binding protein [Candidatus Bipolaricaulota bacterium]
MNVFFHKFYRGKNDKKRRERLKQAQYQTQIDQKLVQDLNKSKAVPSLKQLKYISKFFSKKESMAIKILLGVLTICGLTLAGNVYMTHSELVAAPGGEYTEGLVGAPKYINPILAQTNDVDLDLSFLLFSGLLKFEPGQVLANDLAENMTISEDQKEYTLKLKPDLYWDDREKLTADDVIFTIERIKDPQTKSPLIFNFAGVTTEKIDDSTIKFKLENPFAPFAESLTFGILPEHVWLDIPAGNTNLAEANLKAVGSGPYKIKSLTKETNGSLKSVSLIRNDLYHGTSPLIDKLTFKFYPDFNSAIDAINNKKIEGISYLPEKYKSEIFNNRGLNFNEFALPQYVSIFINVGGDNKTLKEKNIRQALAYAIDKPQLAEAVYAGSAVVIDSPILPGYIGYTEDIKKYDFNIEQAKKILDDAGWALTDYQNEDSEQAYPFQVRKKGAEYLEFTLTAPNQTDFEKISKHIQQYWQQIGVKVNLNILDVNEIQKNVIKDRSYQMLLYGEILGQDPDPFPFWHSDQCKHPGLNLSCFKNAKADKFLEDARSVTDPKERETNYIEFQKILTEEAPAIFLFNTTYTYPVSKKINGLTTHQIITPAHRFAKISEWYVNTKRKWKSSNQ